MNATTVSSIRHIPFILAEAVLQSFVPSNYSIWEPSAWEWSIDPNNFPSANIQCNLVLQTWTFKFVRVPFWIKWTWFKDPKVSTIHRYQAIISYSSCVAVFPRNLAANVLVLGKTTKSNERLCGVGRRRLSSDTASSIDHTHFRNVFSSQPHIGADTFSAAYTFKKSIAHKRCLGRAFIGNVLASSSWFQIDAQIKGLVPKEALKRRI